MNAKRRATWQPTRKARFINTLVVSTGVVLAAIGTFGVLSHGPVEGVDTNHGQPVSINRDTPVQPDITYVACADWSNENPAFTDPNVCVSNAGKRVPAVSLQFVTCNNNSYNANGESEELTLTPALFARVCK